LEVGIVPDQQWSSESSPYLAPRLEGAPDPWAQEAADHGKRGTQRLLDAGEEVPPPQVAALLGLAHGQTAIRRRRIILADEQPMEIADSWYPLGIAQDSPLAEARRIKGGAVSYLAGVGYIPAVSSETVGTRLPDDDERSLLDLAHGTPVLTLHRALATSGGSVFEVAVMTMRPERQLHYRMRIS
jgi:GntR family transcriptional regulator